MASTRGDRSYTHMLLYVDVLCKPNHLLCVGMKLAKRVYFLAVHRARRGSHCIEALARAHAAPKL